MTPHDFDTDRERRLNEALLEYVEAVEAGRVPDRHQFLARYPEFASELAEFMVSRDQLERLASPLRQVGGSDSAVGSAALFAAAVGADAPGAFSDSTSSEAGAPLGRLGDFRLLRELGRGGMGIVYEAVQISLNRPVALKVLPFAAALDPKQLQRFKNEAQAAAQLHHTNIVPVHAVGCERGVHYYAMQLIEGQSLAAMIAELRRLAQHGDPGRQGDLAKSAVASALLAGRFDPKSRGVVAAEKTGPYPPPAPPPAAPAETPTTQAAAALSTERSTRSRRFFQRAAHLGLKAAQALEHAHQLGVIHRDVKPANLLVDVRGTVWVTDFGLALFQSDMGLTMTGELLGTLRYMSPEQALARRALVDHRTDIYSLGVTLYELLTLRPAFDGADRQELLSQITHDDPKPPRAIDKAIPVELETIVLKATAKNPSDRYTTAQEMADDLQRFLDDKPVLARRPTVLEKAMKWSRRHRSVVGSALALLLIATAASVAGTWLVYQEQKRTVAALGSERDQRERAERSFQQARGAVDFFAQVFADDLADQPGLRAVRQKGLERLLSYYQDFIEQRSDDPRTQGELAQSYIKLANILEGLGANPDALAFLEKARQIHEALVRENPAVPEYRRELITITQKVLSLQGCAQVTLLTRPDVRDELKLRDDQVAEIERFAQQVAEQRPPFKGPHPPRGDESSEEKEARRKKFHDQAKKNAETIAGILTAEQAKRLGELSLQMRGPYAFREKRIAQALELSDDQRQQIRDLFEEQRVRNPRPGPWERGWRMSEEERKFIQERIMDLLTPGQKEKWEQLIGAPFAGKIRFEPAERRDPLPR